jgi:small subunit ribosomal protein S20
MAITKSAKKEIRGSAKKRVFNLRTKRDMKESVKDLETSISGDKKELKTKLSLAYKKIDKAVKRGVIKKGTGDRKKSRLTKRANKASA